MEASNWAEIRIQHLQNTKHNIYRKAIPKHLHEPCNIAPVPKHHAMKTYAYISGSTAPRTEASLFDRFTPGARTLGSNCIGDWVEPRAVLMKRKIPTPPEIEPRSSSM